MADEWEADKRALEEEITSALAHARLEAARAQASAARARELADTAGAAHRAATARAEELRGESTPGAISEAQGAVCAAESALATAARARPCCAAAFAARAPPHFQEDFRGVYVSVAPAPVGVPHFRPPCT